MSTRDRYYRFLADCLRPGLAPAYEQWKGQIESPDWNWDNLIRTAAGEKILPSLSSRFRALGIASQLPGDISDFFGALQTLSRERNEAILAELIFLGTLLNRVGIEPVLLKGAAYLVSGVYADISSRLLADIDLLIPSSALPGAVEVLRTSGFAEEYSDPFPSLTHHHPMLRRGDGPGLELHHTLGLADCSVILPATEMLAQSQPVVLRGARFRLPSPDHLITHQIMHSQVHHHYAERIWPSLRTMYDLALTSNHFHGEIYWKNVAKCFRRAGRYGLFALHLALVREVIGLEISSVALNGPITRVRRCRRNVLRLLPALRCLDPLYLFSSTVPWRARRLTSMLKAPGGLSHVVSTPFRLSFYGNVLQELRRLPDTEIFGNDL